MQYLVTGRQMKEIDRYTIQTVGIPSAVLMERAAMAVADEAERLAGNLSVHIWVVCGNGNNGADGIAAGRILYNKGYDVTIILAGDPQSGNADRGMEGLHPGTM